MDKPRILVADDDKENSSNIEEYLKKEGYNVKTVADGESAFKMVRSWVPHICLLDINMPKLTGLECLKKIRAEKFNEYVVVLLVTANAELSQIIAGLDNGANDYITKPYRMEELRARVRAGLRVKQIYDNLAKANKRLEEAATVDDLTGLRNMRFMVNKIDEEVKKAKEQRRPLSCIMMDMDFFKKVNDEHDHLFGSYVLGEVGKLLKSVMRPEDVPARFGGDEFFILLPNTTSDQAATIATQIRKIVETHTFTSENYRANTTVSLGVCGTGMGEEILELVGHDIMKMADAALYQAKSMGRNKVVVKEYETKLG